MTMLIKQNETKHKFMHAPVIKTKVKTGAYNVQKFYYCTTGTIKYSFVSLFDRTTNYTEIIPTLLNDAFCT